VVSGLNHWVHRNQLKKEVYDLRKDPENLKNFKADLSKSDYFSQFLKAMKKAYVYHMYGKNLTTGDVINYNNKSKWADSGWELTAFDQVASNNIVIQGEKITLNISVYSTDKLSYIRLYEYYSHWGGSYIPFYPNYNDKPIMELIFSKQYSTNANNFYYEYILK